MLSGRATMPPVIGTGAIALLVGLACFALNLWRRL
jgi:hypothetical protein